MQAFLSTVVVVEVDVGFNGLDQLVVMVEAFVVIHLALNDAPEPFHRTVIDATADTGHALGHTCLVQQRLQTRELRESVNPFVVVSAPIPALSSSARRQRVATG